MTPIRIAAKRQPIVWPVSVTVPADGGGSQTLSFNLLFNRLNQPEREALDTALPPPDANSPLGSYRLRAARMFAGLPAEGERPALAGLAAGWDGIELEDDAGRLLPFGEAALLRLFESAEGDHFQQAVWEAWRGYQSGLPVLAAKNS